jgi:pimeloyl-ACP methyl ester carboxylesterase
MHCINQRDSLFNDFSDAEAEELAKGLKSQPAENWGAVTTYCGWQDVPSVYLVCKQDKIIPEDLQVQLASLIGSRIVRCCAGHMVMLKMPEKVVEVIVDAVREFDV